MELILVRLIQFWGDWLDPCQIYDVFCTACLTYVLRETFYIDLCFKQRNLSKLSNGAKDLLTEMNLNFLSEILTLFAYLNFYLISIWDR